MVERLRKTRELFWHWQPYPTLPQSNEVKHTRFSSVSKEARTSSDTTSLPTKAVPAPFERNRLECRCSYTGCRRPFFASRSRKLRESQLPVLPMDRSPCNHKPFAAFRI